MEVEPRVAACDLVGSAPWKEHFGAIEDAVPALVAEDDAVLGHDGMEIRPALAPPGAADLELIGEVGGELVVDPVVDVPDEVVRQRQPLDEMIVDELLAADVQEVHRILEHAAEVGAGDGQVDLRGVLGAGLGREHDRRSAGHRQAQLAEKAGVLEVGALVARARRPDVSDAPRDGEEVAALEDQLVGARGLRQRAQILVAEQLGRADGRQRAVAHLSPPLPRRRLRQRMARPAPGGTARGSRRPSAPPTSAG